MDPLLLVTSCSQFPVVHPQWNRNVYSVNNRPVEPLDVLSKLVLYEWMAEGGSMTRLGCCLSHYHPAVKVLHWLYEKISLYTGKHGSPSPQNCICGLCRYIHMYLSVSLMSVCVWAHVCGPLWSIWICVYASVTYGCVCVCVFLCMPFSRGCKCVGLCAWVTSLSVCHLCEGVYPCVGSWLFMWKLRPWERERRIQGWS